MTRDEAFEFLDRAARGIAEMFGSSCETLVHDMGVPPHPILSIYNGHVSGREVGSTLDILGTARELDPEARSSDQVNLYATTPSGQQIKSSTFHLIGEDYNLALGINFDYTSLVYANRILVDLMSAEADLKTALWQGGDSALADLFDECLSAVGKPVDALSKADRLKIVAMMDQKNAFSYRKSVPFAARRLGVSRYTVYKYLDELAQRLAVVLDGGVQRAEVMHGTKEDAADEDPQQDRQPAEHHRDDGAGDGARAADRAELVREHGEARGRREVPAILHAAGGRNGLGIYAPALGQPSAVDDVAADERHGCNQYYQHSVHVKLPPRFKQKAGPLGGFQAAPQKDASRPHDRGSATPTRG